MIDDIKELFFAAFGSYPYIILFVGMLFAGETVLLPAIYFALAGRLHLSYVVAVALVATISSDFVWYYAGLHIKEKFGERMMNGRLRRGLERLTGAFSRHGTTVLFFSKFVYGTRTAAQVLSGMHHMRLRTYIGINFLGTLSLFAFIAALAYSVDATVEKLQGIAHSVEAAFLAFVIVLLLAHLILAIIFKKTWFQR